MKFLVTGGAGYIGSFMVKLLLDRGYDVVVLDSLERGRHSAVDSRASFIQGDLKDYDFVNGFFKENIFESVFHFAGYISVEESVREPETYFENNSRASLNLFETALNNGTSKFIFSSTAAVYGNPKIIPIPENHPKSPTSPYGESKLLTERNLEMLSKTNENMSFAVLRYFNAAGASLDGSLGEAHDPETHIIPLAIKSARDGKSFNLYGTDYNTPDGTCIRDYIHVLDLVEAHLLTLEKIQNQRGGCYYNIGTGIGISNKEVIEMVKSVSGLNFEIVEKHRRPGDADRLVADSQKIKNELKFIPRYSDLETIVETAWNWHSRNIKY